MRNWKILLIGGPNGTGKTTIAGKLSRLYSVPFLQLEDVRVAMQAVVSEESAPGFKSFFDSWPKSLLTETSIKLVNEYISIARCVWRGVDYIIQNHLNNNQPLILEGDLIIPSLLQKTNGEVKSIFLYDSKENLYKREFPKDISGEDKKIFSKFIEFNAELGKIIKDDAQKIGLPVIHSSPINSLYQRVLTTM